MLHWLSPSCCRLGRLCGASGTPRGPGALLALWGGAGCAPCREGLTARSTLASLAVCRTKAYPILIESVYCFIHPTPAFDVTSTPDDPQNAPCNMFKNKIALDSSAMEYMFCHLIDYCDWLTQCLVMIKYRELLQADTVCYRQSQIYRFHKTINHICGYILIVYHDELYCVNPIMVFFVTYCA